MNSCFPFNGAYQHGIAVEPLIRGSLVHSRLLIRAGGREQRSPTATLSTTPASFGGNKRTIEKITA